MKKKFWKTMSAGIAACMLAGALMGCGSSQKQTTEAADTAGSGTETSEATQTGDSGDIVSLKWIQIGGGQPDNYEAWRDHINEYLADKIGVNIDVEIIS